MLSFDCLQVVNLALFFFIFLGKIDFLDLSISLQPRLATFNGQPAIDTVNLAPQDVVVGFAIRSFYPQFSGDSFANLRVTPWWSHFHYLS